MTLVIVVVVVQLVQPERKDDDNDDVEIRGWRGPTWPGGEFVFNC